MPFKLSARHPLDLGNELFRSPIRHEELQSGPGPLIPETVIPINNRGKMDDRQHIIRLQKDGQGLCQVRRAGKASSYLDPKPLLFSPLQTKDPNTVNVGLGAHDPATRNGDLVFPGKIREFRIVGQMGVDGLKLGGGVQNRIRIHPRHGATHHIAGNIPASPTAGDAHTLQPLEDFRKMLDSQPMQLNRLTGGHIPKSMSKIIRQRCNLPKLSRIQLPPWNSCPQHEIAVLFRLLLVNPVPLETHEIIRLDRLHSLFRVAREILDHIQTVLGLLDLLLLGFPGSEIPWCGKRYRHEMKVAKLGMITSSPVS